MILRGCVLLVGIIGLMAGAGGSPLVSGDVEITIRAPGASAATRWSGRAAELAVPAGAVVRIAGQPGFVPAALPGFGAMYGKVRAVRINDDGQETLEPGRVDVGEADWIGVRNRFHTVVVQGVPEGAADVVVDTENEPVVTLAPTDRAIRLRVYSGPVENASLRAADPVLSNMLYAALWDWLRWLCFGMLWLLTAIDGLLAKTGVGNIGWSIVMLSLAVKVLMAPLTMYADRLQASVNRTQSLLQPRLDEIKRNYKGEEAHNRTLAVYKEHGVNPMYTFKSLVGFLIQIPIFIAAFDMLGENIALDGASFWWIGDLAAPDNWIALPFTLPFFGGYLNLMPALMTGITILSSWLQQDPDLTPELARAQQTRLFVMAGAFFLLFYTFPAGMVLYWTTNNVVHLAKVMLRGGQKPSISSG